MCNTAYNDRQSLADLLTSLYDLSERQGNCVFRTMDPAWTDYALRHWIEDFIEDFITIRFSNYFITHYGMNITQHCCAKFNKKTLEELVEMASMDDDSLVDAFFELQW